MPTWQPPSGKRATSKAKHKSGILSHREQDLACLRDRRVGWTSRCTAFYGRWRAGARLSLSGWTLPGIMTVGAAQIQLKSASQIPESPVWIAGTGPLTLLYMVQLLAAGGRIAGHIDTGPTVRPLETIQHFLGFMMTAGLPRKLLQGLFWYAHLRSSGKRTIQEGRVIRADGAGRLESITYQSPHTGTVTVPADLLLVHDGVVPAVHMPLALNCKMDWDAQRQYFFPSRNAYGESSIPGLFVAGDCAGIVGAKGAGAQGELVARHIVQRICGRALSSHTRSLATQVKREALLQDFLARIYPSRWELDRMEDDTIVCRCEEITAGEIRAIARGSRVGPNQMKAYTRCGMGPCQGRQCAMTLNRMTAQIQGRSEAEVGLIRIRSPLKPITVGELATLHGRTD